jgi:hypothetical protein
MGLSQINFVSLMLSISVISVKNSVGNYIEACEKITDHKRRKFGPSLRHGENKADGHFVIVHTEKENHRLISASCFSPHGKMCEMKIICVNGICVCHLKILFCIYEFQK